MFEESSLIDRKLLLKSIDAYQVWPIFAYYLEIFYISSLVQYIL